MAAELEREGGVGSAQRDQANAARAESAQERVEVDEIRDVIARRRDEASKERDQLDAKRDHDDELDEQARDHRTAGVPRAGDQVSTGRSGSEPSQPSAPPLTISKKSRRPWLSTWISMSWPRAAEASWRVVSTSPS